jgi:hypothetical protein
MMARAVRTEYLGAIRHLKSRGDHREPIFIDKIEGVNTEISYRIGAILIVIL